MANIWQGDGGLEGRWHDIETSIKTAALVARATVDEKLPGRGKLRRVVLKMTNKTLSWFTTFIVICTQSFCSSPNSTSLKMSV